MVILNRLVRFLLLLPLMGLASALTVAAAAPQLTDFFTAVDSEPPPVTLDDLAIRSLVLDVNGNQMALFSAENRDPVTLDQIPDEVVLSVIAVEDESFFQHNGVNLKAMFRAARENVSVGGISQGGSTITQQLIKNLALTSEQTLERKLKEISLAWELEKQMTKREILELYLNTVYFGSGAYGVQAAAEVYFDKDVEDLGWAEAAMITALIPNPTANDPTLFPDVAREQRAIVLSRLAKLGLVTDAQVSRLKREPLPLERNTLEIPPENYFVEEIRQRLLDDFRLGETASERFDTLYSGGLRIHTTYDPAIQEMAEAARDQVLPDDPRFTMAIASVVPQTGAVRAMVGGPGFDNYKYNLVTQGARQPGSSFKTFVLVAAFENGYQPNDRVSGIGPCKFSGIAGTEPYTGNNFGGGRGSIDTIRGQTTRSSNCAYLKLGQIVGLDLVQSTARKMGITTEIEKVLTMPLGVEEVRPLDMASAYATLATGGVRYEPYMIEKVTDREGNVLFEHEPVGTRVVEERAACWATEVLNANVRGGTGTAAGLPSQPAAGKTGTTERSSDAWFVGFTPHLATAVWMGNPAARVQMVGVGGLSSVTGGSFPAQAWGAFNRPYHEGREVIGFPSCAGPDRGPKFLRTEGDAQIFDPCPGGLSLDTNGDGVGDTCIGQPAPGGAGVEVCGYAGTVDEVGNPIPIYCEAGPQPVECPEGQLGVDSNADGVPDACEPDPNAPPEPEPEPEPQPEPQPQPQPQPPPAPTPAPNPGGGGGGGGQGGGGQGGGGQGGGGGGQGGGGQGGGGGGQGGGGGGQGGGGGGQGGGGGGQGGGGGGQGGGGGGQGGDGGGDG